MISIAVFSAVSESPSACLGVPIGTLVTPEFQALDILLRHHRLYEEVHVKCAETP
jgi:hypothetical protein